MFRRPLVRGPFGIAKSGISHGGLSQFYVGYNTVGASTEAIANNAYYKRVPLPSSVILMSIGASIAGNATSQGFSVGLMDDAAGAAGKIIAITPMANTTSGMKLNSTRRWIDMPLGVFVATAGFYWLVFSSDFNSATTSIAFDAGGSDARMVGQAEIDDASISAPTVGANNYSIRASVVWA